jgi:hypothetical protein
MFLVKEERGETTNDGGSRTAGGIYGKVADFVPSGSLSGGGLRALPHARFGTHFGCA